MGDELKIMKIILNDFFIGKTIFLGKITNVIVLIPQSWYYIKLWKCSTIFLVASKRNELLLWTTCHALRVHEAQTPPEP